MVKKVLKSFDHPPGAYLGTFLEVPPSCLLTILVLHCQGEITTFLGIARTYILEKVFSVKLIWLSNEKKITSGERNGIDTKYFRDVGSLWTSG